MRIDNSTITRLHERINTIGVAILGDAIDGNHTAQAIHERIMDAAELVAGWYDADIDRAEFVEACAALDAAIDALAKYADNLAESLIITRYWLERAPQ